MISILRLRFKKLLRGRRVVVTASSLFLFLLLSILSKSGKIDVSKNVIIICSKLTSILYNNHTFRQINVTGENLNSVNPGSSLPFDLRRTLSETRIIYNRVDKSGSRSLMNAYKQLCTVNGFSGNSSRIFLKRTLTLSEQRDLVAEIQSLKPPFIFDRHVYYIDFSTFGVRAPSWINLIREPVPHLASRYYYKRFGDKLEPGPRMGFNGTIEEFNQSFEDCVLLNKHECSVEGGFIIIPYFCGHEPACHVPSRWALERAKRNVIVKYAFVGILEDFDSTLLVLEKIFPQFFTGLHLVYKQVKDNAIMYKSSNKIETHSNAKAVMKTRLSLEYEFYEFVRDRLEMIKKQLNISLLDNSL
ncbi:uronyl 2-sulfotransferase-like [Ptychodera flava]|uniref:uronyl 2-sulfotransferase-like n=1 Tax=Ptychodera flava TaxID=63121 RepID=UPI003969E864